MGSSFNFFFFNLAVLGLSCGMQNLLVVASCRI